MNKSSKNVLNTTKTPTNDDRGDCFLLSNRICVSVVPKLIETENRYMSVTSRPVGCRSSAPAQAFSQKDLSTIFSQASIAQQRKLNNANTSSEKSILQTRQEFHETFANLIKLGSNDKQDAKISTEDYTRQTEIKDMIWLELQAWHADRTLEQQDKYLDSARQGIPDLLNKILNYRWAFIELYKMFYLNSLH